MTNIKKMNKAQLTVVAEGYGMTVNPSEKKAEIIEKIQGYETKARHFNDLVDAMQGFKTYHYKGSVIVGTPDYHECFYELLAKDVVRKTDCMDVPGHKLYILNPAAYTEYFGEFTKKAPVYAKPDMDTEIPESCPNEKDYTPSPAAAPVPEAVPSGVFIPEGDDKYFRILRTMKVRSICYKASKLQGDLAKFNGRQYTMVTWKLTSCVTDYLKRFKENQNASKDDLYSAAQGILDDMVRKHKILGRGVYNNTSGKYLQFPVYFLNLKHPLVKEVFDVERMVRNLN